jgi:hypothetical protein
MDDRMWKQLDIFFCNVPLWPWDRCRSLMFATEIGMWMMWRLTVTVDVKSSMEQLRFSPRCVKKECASVSVGLHL